MTETQGIIITIFTLHSEPALLLLSSFTASEAQIPQQCPAEIASSSSGEEGAFLLPDDIR